MYSLFILNKFYITSYMKNLCYILRKVNVKLITLKTKLLHFREAFAH